MNKMILHFCGPMQHYGLKREGNRIWTNPVPTKSAVAGLIACCGGIPRKSPQIKEIQNSIQLEIECFKTPIFGKPLEKRNINEIPTIWDYQSVRDCPNYASKYNGIYKEYIVDTYFRITLTDTLERITQYKEWILDPYWCPYLGSRSCIPAMPIYLEKTVALLN